MHAALVTGSAGFVGRRLVGRLSAPAIVHMAAPEWRAAVERADYKGRVVYHLAARVHEAKAAPHAWTVDNVEKTSALAEAAARGGARRFVFLSTLKVHGEESERPFVPSDPLSPSEGYAQSKAEAEAKIRQVAARTGLDIAIVRAPLVYGRGAMANLRSMMGLADTPLPLPFASVKNRRSWVHVDDLADLLVACGEDASAAGGAFIAAHDEPFSTPGLIAGIRERLGRGTNLFACNQEILERSAALVGRGDAMRRLTRSLEGDASDTKSRLGWRCARDFGHALEDLVAGWR
jgi:UDP-glucose 4-epimerase